VEWCGSESKGDKLGERNVFCLSVRVEGETREARRRRKVESRESGHRRGKTIFHDPLIRSIINSASLSFTEEHAQYGKAQRPTTYLTRQGMSVCTYMYVCLYVHKRWRIVNRKEYLHTRYYVHLVYVQSTVRQYRKSVKSKVKVISEINRRSRYSHPKQLLQPSTRSLNFSLSGRRGPLPLTSTSMPCPDKKAGTKYLADCQNEISTKHFPHKSRRWDLGPAEWSLVGIWNELLIHSLVVVCTYVYYIIILHQKWVTIRIFISKYCKDVCQYFYACRTTLSCNQPIVPNLADTKAPIECLYFLS
jgi:hypothetical protein